MRRAVKIAGWTLGVLAVLLVLAVTGVYLFVTSDYVRAQLENRATAFSGRETRIGKVSVRWGWVTHVLLDDVQVSNTDWGQASHLFTAKQIELDIALRPLLLHGDLVFPTLVLHQPVVALEKDEQGQWNWSPEESPVATGALNQLKPEHRDEVPLIGRLEIDGGRVSYRDAKRKLALDGTVQTATGQAPAEPTANLDLQGSIGKEPLAVHFVGGSVLMLRDTNQPYPVDLKVNYGATLLTVQGTLQDPFQFTGSNVRVALSGSNLADIFPLLGIPGPPTPPYRLAGKLTHEPGIWRVVDLAWHAGDSDLAGDIAIDHHAKPSFLTAHLTSDHLAFADLAPLVGATPESKGNVSADQKKTQAALEAKGELFPDVPLQMEKLRAMNMDVTLDANRVVAPDYLPVRTLAFRVRVQDGQATVNPLRMEVAGGTLAGEMALDVRGNAPQAHAALTYQDVDLKAFFRGSDYFDTTKGKLRGRVRLVGQGHSLAEVMGTATGDVVVTMSGGTISSLMVSLAGLQIADALVLYITGDDQIPIRCALGRLNFNHGLVVFDRTLMDTRKSVVHVNGEVRLKTQEVDTEVTADTKKFDLLDLHAPVVVRGKIRSPRISIGRLIPIPLPDFGGADDIDCDGMTRQLLASD
ncbi:AsmA family protein [Nitrospirillum sp. BR 11752]|uniref:AsmA family protein n=1 Tax=Nitrospirillum sp. BR 11752 TaxID=3104293 RepID=UPI002EA4ECBB|nr:AsmA family protein [Nitrospirillum sp. BR 11752]